MRPSFAALTLAVGSIMVAWGIYTTYRNWA
jgi:hypothetical protein